MSALALFATGLAGINVDVQTDSEQQRAILTPRHLLLPARATQQQRLGHAAVAHAAAHWLHSVPGRSARGLKPMGVALMSAVEDARVERLLLRDYPGLRCLFLEWIAPEPASDDLSFSALLTRMDRLLANPRWQDGNHWVDKARRLFEETATRAGLQDYEAFRAIASILANDLGQMRVRFDPQQHVVAAPYRDDNSYLWDFGDTEQPPDDVLTLQLAPELRSPVPREEVGDRPGSSAPAADLGHFSYPEWDYRTERLRPDWCTVVEKSPGWQGMASPARMDWRPMQPMVLSRARRLSRPRGLRRQPEGDDIDLNAAIEVLIDQRLRLRPEPRMFMRAGREFEMSSTLVLLDLSESVNDRGADGAMPLLDVEKQGALLLAEAAAHSGDRVAIHGFSSNTRSEVYYTRLLDFGERPTPASRARVEGVQARCSTRIGAALRHAAALMRGEASRRRAILVVTDGLPSDIDVHDPRYLVEDARAAVMEARRSGVRCHCIAVDESGEAYARRIFGWRNYSVTSDAHSLPRKLQRACARLAAN